MAVLFTQPYVHLFDDDGYPLAGGKIYSFDAGTDTPKATFTDASGTVNSPNPVVLDAAGRAVVWLSGSYKFKITDAADNIIRVVDNVTAFINTLPPPLPAPEPPPPVIIPKPPTMLSGGMVFNGQSALSRNGMVGMADGKAGTIFTAVRFDNSAGDEETLFMTTGGTITLVRQTTGRAFLRLRNSQNENIFQINSGSTLLAPNTLYTVLASWDLEAGFAHLFINDENVTNILTHTNDVIDYTVAQYRIGAVTNTAMTNKLLGDMYFFWFDASHYLDLTLESNRRKFHNEDNVIAALGTRGEKVTGRLPSCFFGYGSGTEFIRDRGKSNANWGVTGTTAAPISPPPCVAENWVL